MGGRRKTQTTTQTSSQIQQVSGQRSGVQELKVVKIPIEELPNTTRATIEKLKSAGIYSVQHLSMFTVDELVMYDVTPETAARLLRKARALLKSEPRVFSLKEFSNYKSSLPRVRIHVNAIDNMLGGGLEPRAIYEFAGEFGAGKTQLCHQLAVTVQLSYDRGGVAGAALYIDTEGTFTPSRIKSIAERFGLDLDYVFSNIYVTQPKTVDDLLECIRTDVVRYVEDHNVKLIIVDSLIGLFRAEYPGRENLALRQQRLNYALDWLSRVAKTYNIFVVITNQVMDVPMGFGSQKPAGGNIMAHGATHRFLLYKVGRESGLRAMEVLDSPALPEGLTVKFRITERGLEDV